MKHYFVKRIPLFNETISVGDFIQSKSSGHFGVKVTEITKKGDYLTDELDFHEYINESYFVVSKEKAIKVSKNLYLCSEEIELLDKYTVDGKSILTRTIGGDNWAKPNGAYKVIAQISEKALWIKEYAFIYEADVIIRKLCRDDSTPPYDSFCSHCSSSSNCNNDEGDEAFIKGACGHFH